MKILYINTYWNGGGAEKVARQLYYGMRNRGAEVFFLAGRQQKKIPKEVNVIYTSFLERCATTIKGGMLSNTLLKTKHAQKEIIRTIVEKNIDIVHFHNLHGNYFGISDLKEIGKYCKNIVVTLHDMWVMTGCCPHAMECTEWYLQECRKCRGNAAMNSGKVYAGQLLDYKKKYFVQNHICFVTPSEWLKECCMKSYLRSENLRVIHNGIDIQLYQTGNKREIRKKYHLPDSKNILLFSANGITNPYKGFDFLKKGLQQLRDKGKYFLLIVGNKEQKDLGLSYEVFDAGYVTDEKIMNELYAAADLFILPSMADVFPFTMLESMASGTPVLAFDTGGIPEAVTSEAGWIVPQGDSSALANEIENIFADKDELKVKADRCHAYIEENFTDELMLNNYSELYKELLSS